MSEREDPKQAPGPEQLELASGGGVLLRQAALAAPAPRREVRVRQLPVGGPTAP